MPTLKDNFTRIRDKARSAWAAHPVTSKIRRPSRRTVYWTAGVTGGVVVALVLFLGLFDWNYLKGPVEKIASARTGRTVKIDGDLSVKLISWTPGADVHGLRIANPAWAGGGDMTAIDRMQVQVKLMPLFRGRVIMPKLILDNPRFALVREASGRNNWTFKQTANKPLSLPPIRRFEINNGLLDLADAKRKLVFHGRITSSEVMDGKAVQAFKLLGDGTLNQAKFDMVLTGGPLLNVDPDKPYPFDARVLAGDTKIAAKGAILKPFDLGVFDTSLKISGSDMADLYYLTGLAFPNSPPYDLGGQFGRRGFVYTYNGISGRVGDSDIHGDVAVETGRRTRPLMTADLSSRKLDFDDLTVVLGAGAKSGGGETASPQQARIARTMAVNQRLFPDTPLRVERLRVMDARVRYNAATVTSDKLPVRKASVDLTLDNGLLTMDPIAFGFPRGQLAGLIAINARKDIPAVNLDLRLTGTRIEEFVPANFKPVVSGSLIGRAKLSGSGLSVSKVASTANGQVSLVIPQGEMRKGVAELLGVNVLNALFTDKSDRTPLRCAVADFKVTNGVATAQTIVVDTGPVIATGGGIVDLKSERMSLRIKGHPKEVRLLRLNMPLQLEGSLRDPRFGVESGAAVGQAGLAAVAGAILAPLAAILPFVNAGGAEDANCQALVNQAGTGNPAKVTTTAEKVRPAKAG